MGARDLGLVEVASVVDQEPDAEGVEDVGSRADVVGVGMGDPEHIDGRASEVCAETIEQVPLGDTADVAAAAAVGGVAGVDEKMVTVREVDENRKALPNVEKVDDELSPSPAVW
jgi:hypothetical protein